MIRFPNMFGLLKRRVTPCKPVEPLGRNPVPRAKIEQLALNLSAFPENPDSYLVPGNRDGLLVEMDARIRRLEAEVGRLKGEP